MKSNKTNLVLLYLGR